MIWLIKAEYIMRVSGKVSVLLYLLIGINSISLALPRPINPSPEASTSETDLDYYFRVAFRSAVTEDFDTAIINYTRAANVAEDSCDRQHAEAGIQAATEAKEERNAGRTSLLTQIFARRLEDLALPLPCTTQR
jgi:hypothetical protein